MLETMLNTFDALPEAEEEGLLFKEGLPGVDGGDLLLLKGGFLGGGDSYTT